MCDDAEDEVSLDQLETARPVQTPCTRSLLKRPHREDIRIPLSQNESLDILLPRAAVRLESEPLLQGDQLPCRFWSYMASPWRILEPYGCSGVLSPRGQLRRNSPVRCALGTLMPAWSEDLRAHPGIATLEGRLDYALCLNSGTAFSETNLLSRNDWLNPSTG